MKELALKDMNVLITGGNKGIGLTLSKKLIRQGANVYSLSRTAYNHSTDEDESDNFKKHFHQYKCDITSILQLQSALSEIKAAVSNIDILINNAGISDFNPFTESDLSLAEKIIQTNLIAAINLTHFILPDMIENQKGMIINITSISVKENFANCSVYNASKSGLISFSRSLRKEVRTKGIKIIDIIPGATLTDLWDDESRHQYQNQMMLPDDVSEVIYECIRLSVNNRMMIEEIIITPQSGNL